MRKSKNLSCADNCIAVKLQPIGSQNCSQTQDNLHGCGSSAISVRVSYTVGDFRVVFHLCFKVIGPSAKPFKWKLVLFTCKFWFIYMWITKLYMKGFALGLALKQRRKAIRKSPIGYLAIWQLAYVAAWLCIGYLASKQLQIVANCCNYNELQVATYLLHQERNHGIWSLPVGFPLQLGMYLPRVSQGHSQPSPVFQWVWLCFQASQKQLAQLVRSLWVNI